MDSSVPLRALNPITYRRGRDQLIFAGIALEARGKIDGCRRRKDLPVDRTRQCDADLILPQGVEILICPVFDITEITGCAVWRLKTVAGQRRRDDDTVIRRCAEIREQIIAVRIGRRLRRNVRIARTD